MSLSPVEIGIYATAALFPWLGFAVYVLATAPKRKAAEAARAAAEQKLAAEEASARALAKRAKQRPWENIQVPKIALHQAKGHAPSVETPKPPVLLLLAASIALCGASWAFLQFGGDAFSIRGTAIEQGPELKAKKGVEIIKLR